MAPLTSSLRPGLLIMILIWFVHRTHTFTIKPMGSPSKYQMRLDNSFPNSFHRSAANNMDSRKETPISDFQGKKTTRTRSNPSDSVLEYLHNVLHVRNLYHSIYNQIGHDLRQSLQLIVQEIADLLHSNSEQFKQRQRKNKKGGDYRVAETSDFVSYGDELPPPFGPGDDSDTEIYSRGISSTHNLFPSQSLPSMLPVSKTPPAYETPISQAPPPSPPPGITVIFKTNKYEEIYHIHPSPRYRILNLFGELMDRRTNPLSVSFGGTESCRYIENVNNLGNVDAVFEWRIVIINGQTEEIWNSQCLPPDNVTLKFGYEVIITLQQRPGVSGDYILFSQDLEEEYDETLDDLL